MEKLEGAGESGSDETPSCLSSGPDGPPIKKPRLEEIPGKTSQEEEANNNTTYDTEREVENLLSLDDDEFTSLLETSEIEDVPLVPQFNTGREISEETKTTQEKFNIDDYTEKISGLCQKNTKLSRHQLLILGRRFSTKFRRSPALTFLLGAINAAKTSGIRDSGENKKSVSVSNQGIKLGSEGGNTTKKIFITKDGKLIVGKVVGGSPVPASASLESPAVATGQTPVLQKVQITKSADGKIQVRGLLPGQQLVQMPDGGRLQIFSQPPLQHLLPKPKQVQSPIKRNQRNPNIVPSPSPATPIQPSASPATPATPVAGAAKQKVVGIQSLGNNTVTIKDGKLIVQGPDHEVAMGISKKLTSGEARLGNVNRKQVLVMLGQEESPPPAQTAVSTSPQVLVQAPPASVTVGGNLKSVTPLTSIIVTAQLVQGPRIILQGLQGVQLEQEQLTQIQQ